MNDNRIYTINSDLKKQPIGMMMEIIQIDLMFQVYLRSMCKLFLNNPRLIQLRLTNKLNDAFSWFLNNFYEKTHLYLRSYKNKNAIASTFCVIQLLKNLTEFIWGTQKYLHESQVAVKLVEFK